MNTNELIAQLGTQAPVARLSAPAYYAVRLVAVLVVYALGAHLMLGARPDLAAQFVRPAFALEIALLVLLTGVSAWAAILSMYPDMHQKTAVQHVPYAVSIALVVLILFQLAMPGGAGAAALQGAHGAQCAICIASLAVIPSALIFGLMRRGASIHPVRSGSFAVLAASGIGCLTLRLCEANDALVHLAAWHYLPTLLFAALGAWIGRAVLKW